MARSGGRSAKITKLGVAQKVNPIPREKDNTQDVERRVLAAKTKRKWQAPDESTPGFKHTAPPAGSSPLPS